jgi:hypothetical protein
MTPSRQTLQTGGIVAPAVGREGPNGCCINEDSRRTAAATATAKATAATATATVTATEEEECDGCEGADSRRRLDDSLIILANEILLRLIAATTVGAVAVAESGDRDNVDA